MKIDNKKRKKKKKNQGMLECEVLRESSVRNGITKLGFKVYKTKKKASILFLFPEKF